MDEYILTVKMTNQVKEKLEMVAKDRYRGTNMSQAVRWLIEDEYERLKQAEDALREAV